MRQRALALLSLLSLLSLLTSACSSDEATKPGTPLTVWVFEERITPRDADRPLANVAVAFDPPAGERVLRRTDAEGRVTFDGDFRAGGASVTVLSNDHVFVTYLEASPEAARAEGNRMGKPADDLVMFAPRLDRTTEARTVSLRGELRGRQSADHVVSITSSSLRRLGSTETTDNGYAMRVPRDQPFFLLGRELRRSRGRVQLESDSLVRAVRVDLTPRASDDLLDLDLAILPSLPVRTVRVRAQAPAAFGVGSRASAALESTDSALVLSVLPEPNAPADGRTHELDLSVIETDIAPERLVTRVQVTSADGSQSVRLEAGPAGEGATWNDFLLPPSIPEPDRVRTIRDPISLEGFPAGADLYAEVYGGESLLWILKSPPGGPKARSFVVPYRGEISAPFVQVFALSLSARRERLALPERGELYRYSATFRDVLLRKQ